MITQSTQSKLVFKTDVSQAAADVAEGQFLLNATPAMIATEELRQQRIITMGQVDGPRMRGCMIKPVIDSGEIDDAVCNVSVFGINPIVGHATKDLLGWDIFKLGDLVCTASTLIATKGKYGSEQIGSYRACDTLVYTPTTMGTALAAAYAPAPSAHSPADNTQGYLFMPDLGGVFGLILAPADSKPFNALVTLIS